MTRIRPPNFVLKFAIGAPVFAFLRDRILLPSGAWFEGLVMDYRPTSSNLSCEYKIRLTARNGSQNILWVRQEDIRRNLGISNCENV